MLSLSCVVEYPGTVLSDIFCLYLGINRLVVTKCSGNLGNHKATVWSICRQQIGGPPPAKKKNFVNIMHIHIRAIYTRKNKTRLT